MTGLLVVVLFTAVVAVAFLSHRTVASTADAEWLAGSAFAAAHAQDHDDAIAVSRRYLTRHARHRLVGGTFGVLLAVVVGVRWHGSLSIGIGSNSPLADVLFCGVAGVIVGTLSAERFRIGSNEPGLRAASLAPRGVGAGAQRVVAARSVAIASLSVAVLAGATGHGWLALGTAMLLVVPLAAAELVRVVITERTRPVMSDRAQLLDARLRSFAASSVAFLELATAALMLGWTTSKIDGLTGVVAFARFLVVIGSLVVAIVLLLRSAPRRSDDLSDEPTTEPGGLAMQMS